MCGRYALSLKPSEVRQQLEASQMPVDESPDDDSSRQTYNFAPGSHGLVYRADGSGYESNARDEKEDDEQQTDGVQGQTVDPTPANSSAEQNTKYKLQAMKWGLIPFWTKRSPEYSSMLKTINCRDDSLYEDRGMWTSMKKKKRCIVVAQGFYEWLKKNNGKEKIPHYTKRKDGQLMCFAGLWDSVQYEGTDEKLYTYTIITTDSNKQLKFLHDRMPVILENGSEAIRRWLDPKRTEWSKELQALLKPYEGELECYPVSKEVGKVGNNSPSFVVPINSSENKNNIANFFGNQRKAAKGKEEAKTIGKTASDFESKGVKVEHDVNETRGTAIQREGNENNAPLPVPDGASGKGIKRERSEGFEDGSTADDGAPPAKRISAIPGSASQSPQKSPFKAMKKGKSATSNSSAAKSSSSPKKGAAGDGSRKITSFFSK